ncbi:MAG: alpha/beta hydrolase, partial [Planctomycetota bacterium]
MKSEHTRRALPPAQFAGLLVILAAGGCASPQPLMPTPVVFYDARVDPFDDLAADEQTTVVEVFYATDRTFVGPPEDREYTNGMRDRLRLGQARMRLGEETSEWEDLHEVSVSKKRDEPVYIHLEQAREMGELEHQDDRGGDELEPGTAAFVAAINDRLARSKTRDIDLYVHGFKVDFYHGCAVSAGLHHFSGRRGVPLVYGWASRQTIML